MPSLLWNRQTEPLKHQLKGYWSRRINDEHVNLSADDKQYKGSVGVVKISKKLITSKKNKSHEVKGKNNAVTCASDVDPFIGKLVAIDLSSDYGKELMVMFGFKLMYDAVNFEMNTDAGHLLGTVMRKHNKTNRYEVVWQFTFLKIDNRIYVRLLTQSILELANG